MNLFRSEEDARNSATFNADWAHMLMPVARWAEIFSSPMFRERGRSDYIGCVTCNQRGRGARCRNMVH
jgi:hypothetical protein